jgi:hypothetical protein
MTPIDQVCNENEDERERESVAAKSHHFPLF